MPRWDYAKAVVGFDPAEMFADVSSSGGKSASSEVSLGTTVYLRGPATATKVTVVEEFTVTGSIEQSGDAKGIYTPCIGLTSEKGRDLEHAGCGAPIRIKSGEVSETWVVTATLPATDGKAQFMLDEGFDTSIATGSTLPPAQSASVKVTITPHQHIIGDGWTYTAAGNFTPRP